MDLRREWFARIVTLSEKVSTVRVITSALTLARFVRLSRRRNETVTREAERDFIAGTEIFLLLFLSVFLGKFRGTNRETNQYENSSATKYQLRNRRVNFKQISLSFLGQEKLALVSCRLSVCSFLVVFN